MAGGIPHLRAIVATLAALAVAGGAYAFTAANTVPVSKAGTGTGGVSGYAISNLHFTLDPSMPVHVDAATFTISPVIPSAGTGKVIIQLANGGAPSTYTCTTNATGESVTCPTTSPQAAVNAIMSATIVAAQ